jgi:hypothetical protein
MRFYVPVGPRGFVFRIGMVATGVMGSLTYWHASRRRSATATDPFARSPWPSASRPGFVGQAFLPETVIGMSGKKA